MAVGTATSSRQRMNGFTGFAAASLFLVGLSAAALNLVFRAPADVRAVWISAAVALVSQLAAFPVIRRLAASNLIAGWGTGSLVRLGTLAAYALAVVPALHLPMMSALLSLALFYFLSMVIEPLFLRS